MNKESFPPGRAFCGKGDPAGGGGVALGKINYWTRSVGPGIREEMGRIQRRPVRHFHLQRHIGSHTAVASLGIGPGDEVIVPSYSFIASSFCILQAGAMPVFADTGTGHVIDPAEIEKNITERTRGIIVVHLYGIVADMDPITTIARRHNLFVIEDCAQAFGGEYKGRKVGTIGDAGCFSFCQSKHFTTGGEGGAVITDNEELSWKCKGFRDHGYDVKQRLNLLDLGSETDVHPQPDRIQLSDDRDAIGHRPGRAGTFRRLEPAQPSPEREIHPGKTQRPSAGAAPAPDTEERKNAYWWCPVVIDSEKSRFRQRSLSPP